MFNISPRLASAETIFFFLACESGGFEKEVDHMKGYEGESDLVGVRANVFLLHKFARHLWRNA